MFPIMFRKKDSLTGNCNGNNRGFTLIELTIVLVVAGLLFVGLWRLLASGNQQVRDQGAANQQEQLIAGVKSFLASNQGQGTFLYGLGTGVTPTALALPTVNTSTTCTQAAGLNTFCSYLPTGFINTTPNTYGQTYSIMVERNDGSATNSIPTSYSFMILTTGGETIPDTSGGRIAGFIGNDGGFIYSNNVCNAVVGGGATTNQSACGAYGTWAVNAQTAYGFAAASLIGGQIASRTYVSPSSDNTSPWLERNTQIPGDPSHVWNTMTTDLYMGALAGVADSNIWLLPPAGSPAAGTNVAGSINFGSPSGGGTVGSLNAMGGTINMNTAATTTGGGTMNVDGGIINMQNGTINMNAAGSTTGGGTINLVNGNIRGTGTIGGVTTPNQIYLSSNASTAEPLINLDGSLYKLTNVLSVTNGCAGAITSVNFNNPTTVPAPPSTLLCDYSIFTDNLSVSGLAFANTFVADTFIYTNGTTPSDMRLKKDIRPLESPLDDVMQLKPVSFAYKSNDKQSLGVIAQDVEKVYPQLVSVVGGGMKGVNYDGLIAPLIGAVQELKKENDGLRQELKLQEERQQRLETILKSRNSN